MGIRARLVRAERLARAGQVDDAAPSVATATADVAAPASAVWAVLADPMAWEAVLPGVSRVRVDGSGGAMVPGQHFSWRSGGVGLRSAVQRVVVGKEFSWTGRAMWLVAVHRNTIEALGADRCRLISSESMTGALAGLLLPSHKLEVELQGFVDAIAAAAEAQSE